MPLKPEAYFQQLSRLDPVINQLRAWAQAHTVLGQTDHAMSLHNMANELASVQTCLERMSETALESTTK